MINDWLVVDKTPLNHMTSSVGVMTFPIYGKIYIKKCLKPPTRYSILYIYIYMMSIDFLCKLLLHMIDTTRAVD